MVFGSQLNYLLCKIFPAIIYLWTKLETLVQTRLIMFNGLKGIVSRVWGQLQWIPSDRSEEFRIAGAYIYSLLTLFSCFNSKKACFGGFLFDSHSVYDLWQLQITLRMMSYSRRSALANRSSRQEVLLQSQKVGKNCGNNPASNITLELFIWKVTYLLMNESYKYNTDRREWSAVVTHYLQNNY
jgi:hypothetical protein